MSKETSPLPPKQMDFSDAIRELMNGKKIRRQVWPVDEHGFFQDGFLNIARNGNHRWIISEGDLRGEDWITL